ncbi:YceD family protein [Shimia sp. FJ5]|uniref:YceD family protein n=1 Tax=Shimia sp. FJ5 TaxID=3079054 RepID=UPI002637C2C1|nr:DUF177 domain-containing protein [Shimia sp. FJ5]MDV4144056.1 DUF177 domain-containing protein [Shimia sp. FJ5]
MTTQTDTIAPLRVADLPQNRVTRFDLAPTNERLNEIAEDLGLLGLRKLRFHGELRASGRTDWRLTAHLGATVDQPCVVTLEPVRTRIEADIERLFLKTLELPEEIDGEVEMPEDDTVEELGAEIDIETVMREALALNLPLYPRKDEAELGEAVFTEPGKDAMRDEDARPFAGLAALRDKLDGDDEK